MLVLEAGGEHPLNVFSKVPLLAALTLNGEMDWKYNTEPQRHSSGAYVDRVGTFKDLTCFVMQKHMLP